MQHDQIVYCELFTIYYIGLLHSHSNLLVANVFKIRPKLLFSQRLDNNPFDTDTENSDEITGEK